MTTINLNNYGKSISNLTNTKSAQWNSFRRYK